MGLHPTTPTTRRPPLKLKLRAELNWLSHPGAPSSSLLKANPSDLAHQDLTESCNSLPQRVIDFSPIVIYKFNEQLLDQMWKPHASSILPPKISQHFLQNINKFSKKFLKKVLCVECLKNYNEFHHNTQSQWFSLRRGSREGWTVSRCVLPSVLSEGYLLIYLHNSPDHWEEASIVGFTQSQGRMWSPASLGRR